jgi:hypothetical protein
MTPLFALAFSLVLKYLNYRESGQMDSFSTAHTRPHHRGRGTFKNRTWVAGERSGSSSPFQAGHLGVDAPRWERGGGRGGRGRGKGRSPKPEFGSLPSQELRNGGDVSEVEGEGDDAVVDGAGAEPGPSSNSDEPVLDTLEERDRFYQEVSPRLVISFLFPRWIREKKNKPWQTSLRV